jgi:hypothetical protein
MARAFRVVAPSLVALTIATAAHAQGTMDFSGAATLMGTFKTGMGEEMRELTLPRWLNVSSQ